MEKNRSKTKTKLTTSLYRFVWWNRRFPLISCQTHLAALRSINIVKWHNSLRYQINIQFMSNRTLLSTTMNNWHQWRIRIVVQTNAFDTKPRIRYPPPTYSWRQRWLKANEFECNFNKNWSASRVSYLVLHKAFSRKDSRTHYHNRNPRNDSSHSQRISNCIWNQLVIDWFHFLTRFKFNRHCVCAIHSVVSSSVFLVLWFHSFFSIGFQIFRIE